MLRKVWILLLVVAVAVPALAGPARKKKSRRSKRLPTVAIWNVRELGVDPEVARKVRYDLVHAFGRTSGFRLVADKTVEKRLKKGRIKANTPLPKAVRAIRVTHVLTGTMGGLGEEVSLDLKLLDGRSGKEVRRVAVSVPMEIQPRRAVLDELLVRLLTPTRWVGSLGLDVSVDGAQVHLDGTQVATTPLGEPLTGLTPGKHILRITKEGYGEFSKFVVIRYLQTARLKVDLNNAMVVGLIYEQGKPKPKPEPEKKIEPKTPPPEAPLIIKEVAGPPSQIKTVMAWTLLGLGAGLVGAGVVTMVINDPHPNDSRTLTVLTPICYTAGGLSLVGALVLFLIGGDSPASEAEKASMSVHPVVFGDGMGLGMAGRF